MKVIILISLCLVIFSVKALCQVRTCPTSSENYKGSLISKKDSSYLFEHYRKKMFYPVQSNDIEKNLDLKNNLYPINVPYHNSSKSVTFIRKTPKNIYSIFDGTVILISEIDTLSYVAVLKCGEYYISYTNIERSNLYLGQKIQMGKRLSVMRKNIDEEYAFEVYISKGEKDLNLFDWMCL